MRNAALILIGIALLLVQGNFYRFMPVSIHGITPSLVLPLVLFLGVHEPSMARGALLSSALGYATDLFASAPVGVFTFTYVASWWLSRVAAVRLTAQTIPTQMFMAFVFSLVESAVVLMLVTIFGHDPQRPLEMASILAPHAAATGLCAPPVFSLAHKLHQGGIGTPRQTEGSGT